MSCYAFFKGWLPLSPPFDCNNFINSFTLNHNFKTLTYNLGCFPLDLESYHSKSVYYYLFFNIQSLFIFSKVFQPPAYNQCFTLNNNNNNTLLK